MRALKYSDIILLPQYSTLRSRSKASTAVHLGSNIDSFVSPIIPANMRAVIDEDRAFSLSEDYYFYTMHRFGVDPFEFCKRAQDWKTISISIGVKPQDKVYIAALAQRGLRVDYITIDIAHGHSIAMKEMIKCVKKHLPDTFVIAGNVATSEAVKALAGWGADCAKVGIGQGYVCITKDKTGFTRPMFSCVEDCARNKSIPIIADGGVRCNGDITKALVAGADMVMAGSIFSQCVDSPAVSTVVDGGIYKQYFGSASEYNKKEKKHIEGVMKEVPSNNMTYQEKLTEIKEDLQSAISYAGGHDLSCFKKVKYLEI